MTKEPLDKLDLNLLIVFDAVMAEGSVKKAAQRLGMNPPAVSQSLGRLRDAVDAELFIRAGHGLKPTPRASQMWTGVRSALGLIKTAVAGDSTFDPQRESRTITLDLPAGADALMVPKLAERTANAPGLQFRVSTARAFNVLNDLRFGESWLAFDFRQITEPGYHCEMVTEQDVALMARRGHPALRNGLTIELYQTLPQVAVASVRTTSVLPVSERLEAVGMTRVVQYTVPGLLTAISLVANSDIVCSLPICTVRHCQTFADLEMHRLPFDVARMPFFMIWHDRFDSDAGHMWFRETLREICAEL
jgi:DNA-binding transcriptional LysR family regulator